MLQPCFQEWGYLIVFAIGVLENSAFVGAVVPGDAVLLVSGLYAQRGAMKLAPIMLLYFVGALIGDSIGYLIGRKGGRRVVERWGNRTWLHRDLMERLEEYFRTYGMWAVVIGRLAPVVRSVNTFVAGMSGMPYWRFILAIGLVAAVMSVGFPLLGYLFSGSLVAIGKSLGWVGTAIFVVFVIFLYFTYHRMIRRLEHKAWRRRHPSH